jgi:hypothetical protein
MAITSRNCGQSRSNAASLRIGRIYAVPLRSDGRRPKYWNALKPLIYRPDLTGYDLLRYTAVWLAIGSLIEAIAGPKRAWLLSPVFIGLVLAAKVAMVDTMLTMAEVVGAGLAAGLWGSSRALFTSAQHRNRAAL